MPNDVVSTALCIVVHTVDAIPKKSVLAFIPLS
jgi:hypothetical protein